MISPRYPRAMMNSVTLWAAKMFMMCQRIGRPPISTIGFGRRLVSSERREPNPPARMIAFMLLPQCFGASFREHCFRWWIFIKSGCRQCLQAASGVEDGHVPLEISIYLMPQIEPRSSRHGGTSPHGGSAAGVAQQLLHTPGHGLLVTSLDQEAGLAFIHLLRDTAHSGRNDWPTTGQRFQDRRGEGVGTGGVNIEISCLIVLGHLRGVRLERQKADLGISDFLRGRLLADRQE